MDSRRRNASSARLRGARSLGQEDARQVRGAEEAHSGFAVDVESEGEKHIVIVETPPTAAKFIQVTTMMTDKELEEAKLERPDLVFRIPDHMAIEKALQETPEGESITGMTVPAGDQESYDRWMNEFGKIKG